MGIALPLYFPQHFSSFSGFLKEISSRLVFLIFLRSSTKADSNGQSSILGFIKSPEIFELGNYCELQTVSMVSVNNFLGNPSGSEDHAMVVEGP